jgi:hypothetical protein
MLWHGDDAQKAPQFLAIPAELLGAGKLPGVAFGAVGQVGDGTIALVT